MKETIHIYHTNDLHSHFENWPRIHQFLQDRKVTHTEAGEDVLVVDLGDHVDRAHPYTEGTLGRGNVKLLNEAGYDAVTIGNNEGITLSKEGLNRLYEEAEFPVVIANLFDKQGQRPQWAIPYKIFELRQGLKVAITAVTAFFSVSYEQLGWKLSVPLEELKKQVNDLKEQADLVIVFSHLGLHDDEKIAEELPVDLVLGAHTHHLLHEGKEINGTLLAAAGKFGYYVGHVEIDIDPLTKQVLTKRARVYETNKQLKAPKQEKQQIESYTALGKQVLKQPIVSLPVPLENHWFQPSVLPEMLNEALLEWCEADCAFLNAGVVLNGLSEGTVTKYDLHQMLPHPINPCLILLSGAELKEVIKQTLDEKWPHLAIKGLGFRGKVMGRFVYSQIEADLEKYTFKVAGKEIEPKRIYRVATLDMFTYGHFFTELYRAADKQYFMPEFLRDVMEWKLLQLYHKPECSEL
ncbi:2',3'-cyclic-nucleotide 2'-phosphodiesterase (5'-nucleotidase family) [Bacillus ectoiniformans]|uniref:bifunctional metallophosphatase/5'-nucleotidase n=1 Tax=Bacillus ectoiniformans TaxID=1494429 RepID=UPI001957EA46|nr:bifunctional UDP-sugar hydrolase/5'-nucleotidase [Bacillus ectoiniformans]MBM7648559.1 2',3'-cyclic-nucleotide 2'-phosphodiesterase (5'-nucleotidase family) [Bacillus ectoiniformans]